MDELISVVQLPVFSERLRETKKQIEAIANEAMALAATEETLQAVKGKRAELNKLKAEFEARRLEVKAAVMEPYNRIEAAYDECIRGPLEKAEADLKAKITDVESIMRKRCEDRLRDYFTELTETMGLPWLKYEMAGVKIGLTDARQKTPKKLMEQITTFVDRVASDVKAIGDDAEVLAEYKLSRNLAQSIATVTDRRERIEKAKQESVKKVEEPVAEPQILNVVEDEFSITLRITGTRSQLAALRVWLQTHKVKYEQRR